MFWTIRWTRPNSLDSLSGCCNVTGPFASIVFLFKWTWQGVSSCMYVCMGPSPSTLQLLPRATSREGPNLLIYVIQFIDKSRVLAIPIYFWSLCVCVCGSLNCELKNKVARRRVDNSVEGDENNFSWQAQILIGYSSRRASCPVPSNSFFGPANQITSHVTTQNALIPTTAYTHSLPTPHTHTQANKKIHIANLSIIMQYLYWIIMYIWEIMAPLPSIPIITLTNPLAYAACTILYTRESCQVNEPCSSGRMAQRISINFF